MARNSAQNRRLDVLRAIVTQYVATREPVGSKAIAAGGAIVHDNPVVVDGFITTSRGAGTSIDLGLEIVRQLVGEDAAEAISRGIVRTH